MMERRRIQWPEHWTNGGTGISRFADPESLSIVEAALKELGDPDLFISGDALT